MTAFTPGELLAFERLAIRGWPARETASIRGWLWRSTGGGSIRANSVSTLSFHGHDVDAAIAEAERRYAAGGEPVRFVISDIVAPADLDSRLAARGYRLEEPCTTLAKRISGDGPPPPEGVETAARENAEWLEVYLEAVSASRRPVATSLVARVPQPAAFFSCRRDGRVVSTGLSVFAGQTVAVQCMATRAGGRRQGGARAILAAIERWALAEGATTMFLQTGADNDAAQALYARAGFSLAGRYHVRRKDIMRS